MGRKPKAKEEDALLNGVTETAEVLDTGDVIEAHKKQLALEREKETSAKEYLETYARKRKKERESLEEVYTAWIQLLFELARRFHPLSEYGRTCLNKAAEVRREFEAAAGPLMTVITKENVDLFSGVLSLDMQDEVRYGRSKAIGAMRSIKNEVYAVGAAVFKGEKGGVDFEPIMRVPWLYVHEDWRGRGVGDALMGELVRVMGEQGFSAMTVDFPADDNAALYGNLLTQWQFEFAVGLLPELHVIPGKGKLVKSMAAPASGVKSMEGLTPLTIAKLINSYFKRKGTKNYVKYLKKPKDYYDLSLSAYIGTPEHPAGLLLCHHMESGRVRIDYLGISAKRGGKGVIRLLRHATQKAVALYGKSTELTMQYDAFEKSEAFDILYPEQAACTVIEALLTVPEPEYNMTNEIMKGLEL